MRYCFYSSPQLYNEGAMIISLFLDERAGARGSHLPKAIQLENGRAKTQAQIFLTLEERVLTHDATSFILPLPPSKNRSTLIRQSPHIFLGKRQCISKEKTRILTGRNHNTSHSVFT